MEPLPEAEAQRARPGQRRSSGCTPIAAVPGVRRRHPYSAREGPRPGSRAGGERSDAGVELLRVAGLKPVLVLLRSDVGIAAVVAVEEDVQGVRIGANVVL